MRPKLTRWTHVSITMAVMSLATAALAADCRPGHAKPGAKTTTDTATDLGAAAAPLIKESDMAPPERAMEFGLRKAFGFAPRKADPFDSFARPVTNVSFHHPFIWSELRPLFIYNWFPETGILQGGRVKVYAMQIHVALTETLQLTAYKDGYADFESGVFDNESGFVDLAVGLKYNVWKDIEKLRTLSFGLTYEFTEPGDKDVLEGQGDGFFDLFGSYAQTFGDVNFIGTAGVFIPRDSDQDNRAFHWHLHADLPVSDDFAPLVEVNGFSYRGNGKRNAGLGENVPLGIEAADYTTLGAGNVDGHDLVTGAIGFRYKISEDVSIGAAWEIPLTSRKDTMQKRLTMDLVLRF